MRSTTLDVRVAAKVRERVPEKFGPARNWANGSPWRGYVGVTDLLNKYWQAAPKGIQYLCVAAEVSGRARNLYRRNEY